MSITFPPLVVPLERGESASVQTLGDGYFRVRLDFDGDWVFLDMTQEKLEQFRINIDACILGALP